MSRVPAHDGVGSALVPRPSVRACNRNGRTYWANLTITGPRAFFSTFCWREPGLPKVRVPTPPRPKDSRPRRMLAYIDALDENDRRITEVEKAAETAECAAQRHAQMSEATGAAREMTRASALRWVLRILRGER